MSKEKDKRNNNRGFKVPDDARKLAKLSLKKFKKDSGDYYDGKKELKKAYFSQILDYLPSSIQLIVRYGHLNEVKETKEAIYAKITDPEFVKWLKKELKNDLEFDNMELLPNIIYDIIKSAKKAVEDAAADGENIEFDLSDLIDLSEIILKKKIKKMSKSGIDEKVAFDVLSIIPDPCILKKAQYFHIRALFTVLYEHAKRVEIPFGKLIKILLKDDEGYLGSIITFALLERKEKITNFSEGQKKLFNDITEFCFKELEDMKKDDIGRVLKAYVDARKRDESQNKDTNRRYYISSLPESDYPKISKVVERMVSDDENVKKFF